MVYEWKFPDMYPVGAQEAGQELERIYNERGQLDGKDIVDESRPDGAVLHPCFEWRDPVAAELWREHQAEGIVRCLVTTCETKGGEPAEIRAIIHAAGTYRPINVVLESPDMEQEMRQNALRDMIAFKKRYSALTSLAPVLRVIDKTVSRLGGSAKSEEVRL